MKIITHFCMYNLEVTNNATIYISTLETIVALENAIICLIDNNSFIRLMPKWNIILSRLVVQ